MKLSAISTPALLAWLVFAALIIVLGAGFAGGYAKLFIAPGSLDPASLLMWAIGWVLVLAPFALLGQRLVQTFLKKSRR